MAEKYWQKEIETASREEIKAIQDERLKKTVKHVFENVEPYRKRMEEAGLTPDDIKGVEDLHKLPFTVKQDLRDYYPYGLFAVPTKDVVRLHASSGTTGKQIVVGYTRNDLDVWDDIAARQLCAVGADENDFVHVSYGYGLFTGGFGLHGGATKLGATAIPVSSGNTDRQVTILEDFGSTVLCCTPSYAMYIGETLKKKGVDPKTLPLKAGIFGAEPSMALMIDAIAGATVEALCNKLCAGCFATEPQRRFSPGYGDFPLDYQRKIVETLSAPLNIGVNLTASIMLTPSKSVTAVVPLKGCN